jgi:hypothetical protein
MNIQPQIAATHVCDIAETWILNFNPGVACSVIIE